MRNALLEYVSSKTNTKCQNTNTIATVIGRNSGHSLIAEEHFMGPTLQSQQSTNQCHSGSRNIVWENGQIDNQNQKNPKTTWLWDNHQIWFYVEMFSWECFTWWLNICKKVFLQCFHLLQIKKGFHRSSERIGGARISSKYYDGKFDHQLLKNDQNLHLWIKNMTIIDDRDHHLGTNISLERGFQPACFSSNNRLDSTAVLHCNALQCTPQL